MPKLWAHLCCRHLRKRGKWAKWANFCGTSGNLLRTALGRRVDGEKKEATPGLFCGIMAVDRSLAGFVRLAVAKTSFSGKLWSRTAVRGHRRRMTRKTRKVEKPIKATQINEN